MSARRLAGDFAERVAAHHLERAGMSIEARNVRVSDGEIDIIARDADDLVFVEVRSRRGAPGLAAESITDAKLERMWRCAMDYCAHEELDPERTRIDLVVLEMDASGAVTNVEHFPALELPPE